MLPLFSKFRQKNIFQAVMEAGNFNILIAAVKAADLEESLSDDGPITFFAPTDEAFNKLPKGTIDNLMRDKEKLVAILTYHIVPGKIMAVDTIKNHSARTINGAIIHIDTCDGVKVNNANVIHADIPAKNGVIHAIDAVLLPPV
ncbi:MAG: fasciclin domain-containing protein [Candidatus Saccharibacteria bacterium]